MHDQKQPGKARTPDETREAIMTQLVVATHAAAEKPLKNTITTTGVKDSLAMPTLNFLVAKGKLLRRVTDTRSALTPEEVNKQLSDELLKRGDAALFNPLLTMDGKLVPAPTRPLRTLIWP